MPCDAPHSVVLRDPYVRTIDGKKVAFIPFSEIVFTVNVPCGKCGVCRKNKVDEWSFRLRQEYKDSYNGFFVTLTYAPAHVPRSANNFKTLSPGDLTNYFKRLRKWMNDDGIDYGKIKYYAVGEYGTQFERPHYHLIILNVSVDHLVEAWCKIDRGMSRTDVTESLGHVHIGTVTSDSIAYCVKYLDGGRIVPKHARDDRVREFSRMSNHIGAGYLTEEMIAWHKADLSRNYIQDGKFKIALPKYYRNKNYS